MPFFRSDAQYQMFEDVQEKGEMRYQTKFHTGKAYRTAKILERCGYVKLKFGTESSGKQFIIVTITEKGKEGR